MGKLHLSFEEVSALFDRELPAQAETAARLHLRECRQCSAEYSLSVRLERDLRRPPVLSCDAALELLSARSDGQASPPDRAAAERHLAACDACRAQIQSWVSVASALRSLPAGVPSARVDRAIARLANPPRHLRRPAPVLAPRLAIAAAAIVAVLLSGLPLAQAPGGTPAQQGGDRVIVAAAQQIVYNPNNNTLYQLDTAAAAVNALEPSTNDLKVRILIGGEPIRLALNETANTILVLDAVQKRVTEIDAASNKVISATTVDVTGTPTSINVDNTGKILVTSVAMPAASAVPVGAVSVLDSTTKQLETVREIDVAPRMVVVDPLSSQAVLLSSASTKLVDSSYKVIATLPGGVAAAFSRRGDGVAVLSPTGADTTINFAGAYAPTPLKLQGAPRAITALRAGGYLVLLQIDGQGRVVKVSPDGRADGSISIGVAGGDLLYDEETNFFTVAYLGTVASAQVPSAAANAASPSPRASVAPALSSPASSSTPAVSPTASTEPAKSPQASPVLAAAPPTDVLDGARAIGPNLYGVSLPSSLRPRLMAANGSRIWFVDEASRVGTIDMNSGQTEMIAKLRSDANVGFWVAGRSFVFGVDPAGQVHVVNTVTGKVDSYPTNVLSPVSAVAVGVDDRLWIALRDVSYLLVFDPRTHGIDGFDLDGARVNALAVDRSGRVVYADDLHSSIGTLNPKTLRLTVLTYNRRGSTTALIVDGSGTLWLGTSAGDVYSVKDARPGLAINVRMPVSTLALDGSGHVWYLAPIPGGIAGFGFAPVDGSQAVRSIPGPAVGLAFSEAGRTFSADPRGGFYVATEEGQ
jgi:streptogramin lyase